MSKKPSRAKPAPEEPPDIDMMMRSQLRYANQYLDWALLAVFKGLYPECSKVTVVFDLERGQTITSYQGKEEKDGPE